VFDDNLEVPIGSGDYVGGPAVDARLAQLLGGNFDQESVETLVGKTSGFYGRADVSYLDLSWVYEYLLGARDSFDTRSLVANQLNEKFKESPEMTQDVLRQLSEGNIWYGEVTVHKVFGRLGEDLMRVVVRQRVYANERMRNASDSMLSDEHMERIIKEQTALMLRRKRLTI